MHAKSTSKKLKIYFRVVKILFSSFVMFLILIILLINYPPCKINMVEGRPSFHGPLHVYTIHNLVRDGHLLPVAAYVTLMPWRVNTREKISNKTPLHAAARQGRENIAILLINRRGDACARNVYLGAVSTPLDVALEPSAFKNREEKIRIARYMIEEGNGKDCINSVLHRAVYLGDLMKVKFLLENGADINSKIDKGMTPLHKARNCDPKIVKMLIEGGADIDARDKMGRTPLQTLLYTRDFGKARSITKSNFMQLVEKGADLNARDNQGNTFLHHAVRKRKRLMVELALDFGADMTIENKQGLTPIELAEEIGAEKIKSILVTREVRE
jgi:ankyrin repeat protein